VTGRARPAPTPARGAPARHRAAPGESGFTLIELLVTLVIVVAVAAVAAPAVGRARANLALERAAADVVAELDRARRGALRRNETVEVVPELAAAFGVTTRFTFEPDGRGTGGPLTLAGGQWRVVIALDPTTGSPRAHVER
jgi:prepilin-type N-terminal cleavage/methylation domain-containing protein